MYVVGVCAEGLSVGGKVWSGGRTWEGIGCVDGVSIADRECVECVVIVGIIVCEASDLAHISSRAPTGGMGIVYIASGSKTTDAPGMMRKR